MSFDVGLVRLLREADEIHVETQRDATAPRHDTIIWVVTLGRDVYVRSVMGTSGRWYQEAATSGHTIVRVGRKRIPAKVTRVRERIVIDRVSAAYLRKYGRTPSSEAMVKPTVLGTTLHLTPA